MSFMKIRNRVGDRTPPCGTPFFMSPVRLLFPCRLTHAFRSFRNWVIQRSMLCETLFLSSFRMSPSVQTFSNAFSRSSQTATVCCFFWNPSSCKLWNVSHLVLCWTVFPKPSLFIHKEVICLEIPNQPLVQDPLHQFAQAARKANGAVAFWHVFGLPRPVDRDLDCFFQHLLDVSRFWAGFVQL